MALFSLLLMSVCAMADNDKPISVSELPQSAQQFINKNFKGKKVAMAKEEKGLLDRGYDVVFVDGVELEFDNKGNWTSVDCEKTSVPTAIVPHKIAAYVKTNYSGQHITKIEKDNKDYEIELSNGLEITFNKKFKVIEIDK